MAPVVYVEVVIHFYIIDEHLSLSSRDENYVEYLNHWVMHPVARVPTNIAETSLRNKCRCSFYCALFTLLVSAPIGGHLQVVYNTKNSKSVTVYVNGSVASYVQW
jgi:hypothetical protein